MVRRDPRLFDPTRKLVMARFATLYEHDVHPGDPLNIVPERKEKDGDNAKGEVTLDMAVRLWVSGLATYYDELLPTQVETPEEAAARLVTIEGLGGGWYHLNAPWLGEGEKVQGKDAAEERRAEIVARGDTKGVTVEGGDGGWYTVTAPWIDEPEKVQGHDAAMERADELIAEGPPAGWRPLTEEEKAAQAEQEAALAEARAIANREAEEAKANDQKTEALSLGFTDAEWAEVATDARADALTQRRQANADAESAAQAKGVEVTDAPLAGTGEAIQIDGGADADGKPAQTVAKPGKAKKA